MHEFEKIKTNNNKNFYSSCPLLKKNHKFIKYNPKIKKLTGCDRATLILEKIEFFFSKQPDGFYKFIEPCSHRLYKKHDSWAEELGCDRKCFTRSWEKIGFRHTSRRAFEAAKDKFEGKLYASYYDRHLNQMFFVRNHDLANETLKEFYQAKKSKEKIEVSKTKKPSDTLASKPLGTGHNVPSYKETEKTPSELFKNNSHASNEIVKKMVELWTAIVQEGRGQIDLKGKIVPFLKKAFIDKFDSCLQKWKAYCISIARSKFLMGEKTSFKADLEWSLKFETIRKILAGNYGIGDRNRKLTPEELEEKEKELGEQKKAKELEQQEALLALEKEIKNSSNEPNSVKNFRIKWLRSLGEKNYREFLADCEMKLGEKETDLIIQPQERIVAIRLVSLWNSEILFEQPFKRVQIYHHISDFMGKPLIFDRWLGDVVEEGTKKREGEGLAFSVDNLSERDRAKIGQETVQLRSRLREIIPSAPHHFFEGISFETISQDGMLVVAFEDELAAQFYQTRYGDEILLAAKDLWNVVQITVEHKSVHGAEYKEALDGKDGQDEESLIRQAIVALREPSFKLDDAIPY